MKVAVAVPNKPTVSVDVKCFVVVVLFVVVVVVVFCLGFFWGGVLLYVHRNHRLFLGTGAQDGHLDLHTAPELCCHVPIPACMRKATLQQQTVTPPALRLHLAGIAGVCSNSAGRLQRCKVDDTVLPVQCTSHRLVSAGWRCL